MIDENELFSNLKIALEFNREFYPQNAFITQSSLESSRETGCTTPKNSRSKVSAIIAHAMEVIKNRRKLELTQLLSQKIIRHLDLDLSSDTLAQPLNIDGRMLIAKMIAAMPAAHRMVARKDYNCLKTTLPIIAAIANAKVHIEAYGPDSDDYDSLYTQVDIMDQNLLHLAAHNNDYRIFVMLMDSAAVKKEDFKAEDIQGLTPLHIVLLNTKDNDKNKSHVALAILKRMLTTGWLDINEPCLGNETLLHFAARTNNVLLCSLLISLNADVDVTNKIDGNTPMHYACQANYADVVELLYNNHANVSSMNAKGATPRQLAVSNGCTEVVEWFKEHSITTVDSLKDMHRSFEDIRALPLDTNGEVWETAEHSKSEQHFSSRHKHFFECEAPKVTRPRTNSCPSDITNSDVAKNVLFSFKRSESEMDFCETNTTMPTMFDNPDYSERTSLKRAHSESSLVKKKDKTDELQTLPEKSPSKVMKQLRRYEHASPSMLGRSLERRNSKRDS